MFFARLLFFFLMGHAIKAPGSGLQLRGFYRTTALCAFAVIAISQPTQGFLDAIQSFRRGRVVGGGEARQEFMLLNP